MAGASFRAPGPGGRQRVGRAAGSGRQLDGRQQLGQLDGRQQLGQLDGRQRAPARPVGARSSSSRGSAGPAAVGALAGRVRAREGGRQQLGQLGGRA